MLAHAAIDKKSRASHIRPVLDYTTIVAFRAILMVSFAALDIFVGWLALTCLVSQGLTVVGSVRSTPARVYLR